MVVAKIGTEMGRKIIVKAFSKILSETEADDMTRTMAEELIMEGRALEKAETGRNMVMKALRTKFGKIPKEIENAVLGMSDSIALESLLEHAIHSGTLDEFADCL